MRNVEFLNQELQAKQPPGIETVDPRFIRISDLAERGAFDQAAEEIELLHAENIFDIRLICYYLYQVFLEEGLGVLGDLLAGIGALIDRNWDAIGPATRRTQYVNKSLAWLFSKVADDVEYHRAKVTPTWTEWNEADAEVYREALTHCTRLADALRSDEYDQAAEGMARLLRELRSVRDAAAAVDRPREEEPARTPPKPVQGGERAREVSSLSRSLETVSLRVSHSFIELCLKLKAFEALIEKRNFEKAALVSDDVMSIIDGFDPRRHFPELFASFSGLMSAHVGELAPFWDRRDSIEWKTLQQFYEVDLDAFVGD